MNKAVRLLFIAVIGLGIVSIGLTYYQTVVLRDYTIINLDQVEEPDQ